MGESVRALRAADSQLSKHVLEMEEFESNSKQDRAKLLAGSSRPSLSFLSPLSSLLLLLTLTHSLTLTLTRSQTDRELQAPPGGGKVSA
jgi:hypothetical protein